MKNYEDAVGNVAANRVKSRPIKWFVKRPVLRDKEILATVRYHYETASSSKGNDIEFRFTIDQMRSIFPEDSWESPYRMVNVVGALADTRDECHRIVENMIEQYVDKTCSDHIAKAEWRFLQPDAQEFVKLEALVEVARMSTNQVVCFNGISTPSKGVRY